LDLGDPGGGPGGYCTVARLTLSAFRDTFTFERRRNADKPAVAWRGPWPLAALAVSYNRALNRYGYN